MDDDEVRADVEVEPPDQGDDDAYRTVVRVLYALTLAVELAILLDYIDGGMLSSRLGAGSRRAGAWIAARMRPITLHLQWKREAPFVVFEAIQTVTEGGSE